MSANNLYPLAMAESFWANSPLSIARHYGRVKMGNYEYIICNKEGKDIFECSKAAEKAGRSMAIDPGEPADLVRTDVLPYYRKLGRDDFLNFCKAYPNMWDIKEVKSNFKEWIVKKTPNVANASIAK